MQPTHARIALLMMILFNLMVLAFISGAGALLLASIVGAGAFAFGLLLERYPDE